jgi:hypothetical protein
MVQFWVWVDSFLLVFSFFRCYAYICSQDVFHIACHLAAEFGTKLAVLLLQVFFVLEVIWMVGFSGKCYFHHM